LSTNRFYFCPQENLGGRYFGKPEEFNKIHLDFLLSR